MRTQRGWNDRKPQEPDNYPHQTDASLTQFREWFETFAYSPSQVLPVREEPVVIGAG